MKWSRVGLINSTTQVCERESRKVASTHRFQKIYSCRWYNLPTHYYAKDNERFTQLQNALKVYSVCVGQYSNVRVYLHAEFLTTGCGSEKWKIPHFTLGSRGANDVSSERGERLEEQYARNPTDTEVKSASDEEMYSHV